MSTKTKTHFSEALRHLGACKDAVQWSEQFSTAQKAWDACKRGDWMLWAIGRTIDCEPWSDGRKPLLAVALDCACTVKHLWAKNYAVSIAENIAVLRNWIKGKASVEQAKEAKRKLYDICVAAAYAAYAAAVAAAYAAAVAAAYAAADAADAARTKILKECAVIVSKAYPKPPKAKGEK